jgi:SAM-dependent methyltransferase
VDPWDKLPSVFDYRNNLDDSGLAGNIEIAWPELAMAVREHVPARGTVLDFGCGTGGLAEMLADSGYHTHACDTSGEMIETAAKYLGAKVQLHCGSFEVLKNLPQLGAVVSSMVFQFFDDLEIRICFAAIADSIRAGGLFSFAVHNRQYVEIFSEHGNHYKLKRQAAELDTRKGSIEISENEIDLFLRDAEFYRRTLEELGFSCLFEKYPEYSTEFIEKYYLSRGREEPPSTQKYLIMAFLKD